MTNALTILFCLTLMYLPVTTRLSSYVLILVFQGILVAGVYTVSFFESFSGEHLVIAGAVLLFRTILIPSYIVKIIRDLDMGHRDRTRQYHPGFLLQISGLIIAALLLSYQFSRIAPVLVIPLGTALAAICSGGLLIVRRQLLLAHVIGFLIIENGLFLLGVAVKADLPWIIELGAFLDLFVLVFLMGIAINHLKSHFPEGAGEDLTTLHD
jgi:hydrogenase-4 component E